MVGIRFFQANPALWISGIFFCQLGLGFGTEASAQFQPAAEWLQRELSCAQLSEEVKARYENLGSFSLFPEDKKREVERIFAIVCSSRFAKCGFKSCTLLKGGNALPADVPVSPSPSVLSDEQRVLEDQISQLQTGLLSRIEAAKARETVEGSQWKPFSIQGEESNVLTSQVSDEALPASHPRAGQRASFGGLRPDSLADPFAVTATDPADPEVEIPIPDSLADRPDFPPRISSRGKYLSRSSAAFHRFRPPASILFTTTVQVNPFPGSLGNERQQGVHAEYY